MDAIAIGVAFRAMLVIAPKIMEGRQDATREFMQLRIKMAAHALTQLWHDLEEEERVGVKALA
ncbi:hypothetical protein CBI36_01985 [Acetobacter oryzifermentans]|uniref:Uncharacterized protein n=2 Tax=Acetobacter TaxID=434 RepID=A0AAN1UA10_9PROT|nr:hypothetical protein CBI36_01985 [Acetobacter oryzifermentans]AXN01461.1 hypothetical protein CJF59_13550 [Acetobacter pomorum]KAA8418507.1 hypothetical protein FKW33_00610 [Acetobacter sp. DmW_125131]